MEKQVTYVNPPITEISCEIRFNRQSPIDDSAISTFIHDYAEENLSYKPSFDTGDHSNLIKFLREKNRFDEAQKLCRLRRYRNDADYRLGADINRRLAEECNSSANSLLSMCKSDHLR